MELDMFKKCLYKYLTERKFEKIKSKYYLESEKFLCVIDLQKSIYGPTCYINYSFFLGEFKKPYAINQKDVESYTPYVGSRFYFANKNKHACDYLEYSVEELERILDSNFQERIIPPFREGKKYLLKHYGTLYTSFLFDEKIMPLLLDW